MNNVPMYRLSSSSSSESSSDSDSEDHKIFDLAYLLLEPDIVNQKLGNLLENNSQEQINEIESIILHHNQLKSFPKNIFHFTNIKNLDLSNNNLEILPDLFEYCQNLTQLIVKNNSLTDLSLPKTFTPCKTLKELNLSGNQLTKFPEQVFDFISLKYLYLGGNKINYISRNIWKLSLLQMLSLGGNQLYEVPASVGQLKHLKALILCDNQLQSLPSNIANLHNLKSLLLHKNKLRTLPPEIVALRNLNELSLRDNPLVVRFVSNMSHNPASLLELSARTVKLHNIDVQPGDIPKTLMDYLSLAHHCVNPKCKGVFFDNRVEHIKFVDFCGKYRIPLLQYLCSSKCANVEDDVVSPARSYMMKKVLLG